MPTKSAPYAADLPPLLAAALQADAPDRLVAYLIAGSGLPGPRLNLALTGAFADAVGAVVATPDPPVARLEALLDGWAALSPAVAPGDAPRAILPCAAVLAYGQVAVVRPDWWPDEIAKLQRAAADSRWRVREIVALALQRLLAADWPRTLAALDGWLATDHPLVVRAAAAAVAEPPLLRDPDRGAAAVALQARATHWLAQLPPAPRRSEPGRVLRQALGYTVSVATVAAPAAGFALLETLATAGDPDLQWIVRENLKKGRLAPWPDRRAAIQSLLAPQ
ncbi:MAG TPA: hypothetical protein VKY74_11710 [Chloroflexia bacterium]|nr:hypothetical protein [Chloroflexia bacterium]